MIKNAKLRTRLVEQVREERYQCFHNCYWKTKSKNSRNFPDHLPAPGEYPTAHKDECKYAIATAKLHSQILDLE